ncbi:MAG: rhomboid family intramembrane serine protease [Nitrospiraceae bacterium]|nr:rhomboid family intramembrane serine protease [Nitrospiraceae bacterium]
MRGCIRRPFSGGQALIPLSDIDRRPFRFPLVTALIIGANVVMFFLELTQGQDFILRWAVIPAEISGGHKLVTIFSAMFMHGGWLHIIGNMVYFWAFGPEIEDAMGRIRYPIFYLGGGLAATIAQVMMNPLSDVPNLGASGAIAAVMGAFLVTFPRDRIKTVVFIGFFFTITFIPALVLVVFWFVLQLLSEIGSIMQRNSDGVAHMAHIGGMLFGVIAARLFELRRGAGRG